MMRISQFILVYLLSTLLVYYGFIRYAAGEPHLHTGLGPTLILLWLAENFTLQLIIQLIFSKVFSNLMEIHSNVNLRVLMTRIFSELRAQLSRRSVSFFLSLISLLILWFFAALSITFSGIYFSALHVPLHPYFLHTIAHFASKSPVNPSNFAQIPSIFAQFFLPSYHSQGENSIITAAAYSAAWRTLSAHCSKGKFKTALLISFLAIILQSFLLFSVILFKNQREILPPAMKTLKLKPIWRAVAGITLILAILRVIHRFNSTEPASVAEIIHPPPIFNSFYLLNCLIFPNFLLPQSPYSSLQHPRSAITLSNHFCSPLGPSSPENLSCSREIPVSTAEFLRSKQVYYDFFDDLHLLEDREGVRKTRKRIKASLEQYLSQIRDKVIIPDPNFTEISLKTQEKLKTFLRKANPNVEIAQEVLESINSHQFCLILPFRRSIPLSFSQNSQFDIRANNLHYALSEITEFLYNSGHKLGENYRIIVAELAWSVYSEEKVDKIKSLPFNKGFLLNSAVREALRRGFSCDYFILNDSDQIPLQRFMNFYSFPSFPTHLVHSMGQFNWKLMYPGYFGGILALSQQHYERMNGFSNHYWGW
jgi:hypothetical protein